MNQKTDAVKEPKAISTAHTERLIASLSEECGVPADVIRATLHYPLTHYWRPANGFEYRQCSSEHASPYEIIQMGTLIVRLKPTAGRLVFIEAIRLEDGPAKVEHYYAFSDKPIA